MKKKYCVFCGTKNDSKNEVCSNCKSSLNPEDHLWKDYAINHITDELKGKTKENVASIITNYIISHLYGIVFSILFIATAITGVIKITKSDNIDYIKIVDKSPIEITELAEDSEIIEKLKKFLSFNDERYYSTGFYDGKKMTYDDIKNKHAIAYEHYSADEEKLIFNSCDETKKYPDIYELCQNDSSFVIGEYALGYRHFTYDAFNTSYKKMYGNDKNAEKINFTLTPPYECNYYENLDEYVCHTMNVGWWAVEAEYTEFIKALKINDIIEYYDIYVFSGEDGTFKDLAKTQKISDIDIWEDNSLIEQGQIYKHIFKDNGNGEYYWFSSEPVDSLD